MLNQRPNDFRTKLCYLVDIIIVYVSYTHVNKLYFKINLIVVSMLPATGRAYTILHQTKARDNWSFGTHSICRPFWRSRDSKIKQNWEPFFNLVRPIRLLSEEKRTKRSIVPRLTIRIFVLSETQSLMHFAWAHAFGDIFMVSCLETSFLTHYWKRNYENLSNSHIYETRSPTEKYDLSKCMYEMQRIQFRHNF